MARLVVKTTSLAIILSLLLSMVMPAMASAVAGKNYGPWFPPPGSGDSRVYQAAMDPASSTRIPEITDFSCYFIRDGAPLDDRQKVALRDSINIATSLYGGDVKRFRNGGANGSKILQYMAAESKASRKDPSSGKKTPSEVMKAYLRVQKEIFKRQGIVWNGQFDESQKLKDWWLKNNSKGSTAIPRGNLMLTPQIVAPDRKGASAGTGKVGMAPSDDFKGKTAEGFDGEELDDGELDSYNDLTFAPEPDPQLANGLYLGANNPLMLARNVSQGCALDPLQQNDPGSIGSFLSDPGEWFKDLFFWIIGAPVREVYNFLQPKAFVYTFWTPHVERGDTMFNTKVKQCREERVGSNRTDGSAVQGSGQDGCRGVTPLGFSNSNLKEDGSKSVYMQIAFFLQWLVSGTYFVIMFAAAVVYMVRGSKSASFNVMHIIPRIIVSVILTMFGPWLIGMGIYLSNTFVQVLFDYNDQATVGALNAILNATPVLIGMGESDFLARILQVLVGSFTAFFYAIFLIGAVVRNLALILLIAIMPLAAFCLIVPAWQHRFALFVRTTLAVIFVPAIMAFILKLGLSINPLIWIMEENKETINTTASLLGLFLMVVTLWLMARAAKIGRAYATGGGQGAFLASGMGMAGGMLVNQGMATDGWRGRAMRIAGHGLAAGSAASYAGNEATSSLVPTHKGMLASGGSSGPSALRQGLEKSNQASGMGQSEGFGLSDLANPSGFLQRRFAEKSQLTMGENGMRYVSRQHAQSLKMREQQSLDERIEATQAQLGRPLTSSELRMTKDEFYNGSLDKVYDEETNSFRVKVDSLGEAIRHDDGWNDRNGQIIRRGGRYIQVRDKERFDGQSRSSAMMAGLQRTRAGQAVSGAVSGNPVSGAVSGARERAAQASNAVQNRVKYGSDGTVEQASPPAPSRRASTPDSVGSSNKNLVNDQG